MNYNIEDFQLDQDAFNELSGQASKVSKQDLNNQLMLIQEEVAEIAQGLRDDDLKEVLDGAIDTLFTTLGLIQKLRNKGVDVDKAMFLVAKNNLTKFTPREDVAIETVQYYEEQGIDVTMEYSDKYALFVIKDNNSKVRKPIDYKRVELDECIPNDVSLK